MPWKVTSPMHERALFVELARSGSFRISSLCREFGISRKTGYKWLGRSVTEGTAGLVDRSRAPKTCRHRLPQRVRNRIIAIRRRHPSWGSPKIRDHLRNAGWDRADIPAASTITALLHTAGLIAPQRRRQRLGEQRTAIIESQAANDLWRLDYKGDFLLGCGQRCYPLTLTDCWSRYLLCCRGHQRISQEASQDDLEAVFERQGLPSMMLMDNGSPFGGGSCLGLSRLSAWLLKVGIDIVFSRPGHPEDNGRHERMHRTLKQETARPPQQTMTAQQDRFDAFVSIYNAERPHAALDGRTPSSRYSRSRKPYQGAQDPSYPGHWETRKVRANGEIKFRNSQHFLSASLSGELVGLVEVDDNIWQVYFGRHQVATYWAQHDRLTPLGPRRICVPDQPTTEQHLQPAPSAGILPSETSTAQQPALGAG